MKTLMALLLALCAWAGAAAAHEIRPVFLEVREMSPGRFEATWKRPVFNGQPLPVRPRFGGCEVAAAANPRITGLSATERLLLRCPDGLAGATIVFDGLSGVMVDGLVRVEFRSGEVATGRVLPTQPRFVVPATSSALEVGLTYTRLGVEHILLGFDHLLFVLVLVLLVRDWRRLLLTATAFTAAHSVTLSLAALGFIHVPTPPVEALIAISILILALEVLRTRHDSDGAGVRRPASMAFAFGLLHGLGFASALSEIGLPQHEIPLSLLAFNVGVELGQVAFILVLLAVGRLARHAPARPRRVALTTATYAIGSMAAFWTIERISSF